jgi:hypothetical protein
MSRSDTLERAAGLPPLLVQVIRAALESERFDPGNDRTGHADALVDFGHLAMAAILVRGPLAPVDNELYTQFDAIATKHLRQREADGEFRAALSKVEEFATRDPIATAARGVKTIGEAAYFYGGLAFGIAVASLGAPLASITVLPAAGARDRGRGRTRTTIRRRR